MNTISYQSNLFQSKRKTNHKEYREFILRLGSIDKIFTQRGIEFELAESYLEQMLEAKKKSEGNDARLTAKEMQRHLDTLYRHYVATIFDMNWKYLQKNIISNCLK